MAVGTIEDSELSALGAYGASKVIKVANAALNNFDSQAYAKVIAEVAKSTGSDVIIISQSLAGKSIAPRLSVKLDAGLVSGAVELPNTSNGFVVKKVLSQEKHLLM